jgi:hypothetical protein
LGLGFAAEFDPVHRGPVGSPPTPYAPLHYPGTYGVWIASGGGEHPEATDAGFALGIKDNGAKFQAGIVFGANALTGSDGTTGYATAIQMAKGHMVAWFAPNGDLSSYITSTVTAAVHGMSMQFQDGGPLFINSEGHAVASIQEVPNAVNGVALTPSISGSPVAITAFGTDATVGLALVPKSSFVYTAAPTSLAGGVSVDSGLTVNTGGLTVSAGTTAVQALTAASSITTGAIQANSGLVLTGAGGPTIRSGAGAATGTQPKGSLWMRSDGAVGSTMYVSQGGGTWNAVAGV